MTKTQVSKIVNKIQANLSDTCCSKIWNIAYNRIFRTTEAYIKLYNTIDDACSQNQNHQWMSLNLILTLNNTRSHITCNPCNAINDCSISLIAKFTGKHTQYYYCKMDFTEIIY